MRSGVAEQCERLSSIYDIETQNANNKSTQKKTKKISEKKVKVTGYGYGF